jgi:hypothetical protein
MPTLVTLYLLPNAETIHRARVTLLDALEPRRLCMVLGVSPTHVHRSFQRIYCYPHLLVITQAVPREAADARFLRLQLGGAP